MTSSYQPGLRVSEYLLVERVGVGTFGEVWKARHHVWEREFVAIKLPTAPDYVRYLQREGLVVHALKHPNIVRVMGIDPYAEIPYLVMELVDGPSLQKVISDQRGGLPIEVALTVLQGVLRGIAAAHAGRILHRDLKPGNVLLNLRGQELKALAVDDVKVSDFGLGRGDTDVLRSIVQSASMDRDNRLVGTLAYMAPELRDGGAAASPASDLYSIGVMLFEMLTGQRPAGAELLNTCRAEVPAALDAVFARLYARQDRRYESAEAVLTDLERRLRPTRRAVPPVPAGVPPVAGRSLRSCTSCGTPTRAEDQFCTQCGQQLVSVVRRCGACGAFPAARDRFCILCGTRLSAEHE